VIDRDVIVVGAGPAGLLLAGELARRGIDAALWEARADAAPGSRAIGIHPPVLAALEASGVTDRLLEDAARVTTGIARTGGRTIGHVRFDRLHTRFPFVATVPQARTEAALAHDAPPAQRGVTVRAVRDRGTHVDVIAEKDGRLSVASARLVVLAAGARGRALAPWSSPRSHTYRDRYLMADVDDPTGALADTAVITLDAAGVVESFPLPGGRRRLVAWAGRGRDGWTGAGRAEALLLRAAVEARTDDHGLAAQIAGAPVSAFGIRRVLARRLRSGRVLAIGDLAHEVSPIGGQGMNLGLLDAVTLAPLIARWIGHGEPPRGLAGWEHDRLASARRAARLAGLNTAIGRARGQAAQRAVAAALAVALSGPVVALPTRAYAMGFDRNMRAGQG